MAAQVVGVDLRQPLSVLQRDEIYAAFSESQLLVFRQQSLGKQEQVDFSQQFGTLERHARRNQGTEEFPLLHVVNNLGPDGELGQMKSTRWHTDKSFRPAPSAAPRPDSGAVIPLGDWTACRFRWAPCTEAA